MNQNIEQALEQEKKYLEQRSKGEKVQLLDFIQKYGFEDPNEFYWNKQAYLLRHQPYVVEKEPYIDLSLTQQYFADQKPALLYTINCSVRYAFVPQELPDKDIVKLWNAGFTPIRLGYKHKDGVVVSSDGDLRIFLIYPKNINITAEYILGFFRSELADLYDNVEMEGEEILIDGKKVAGSAELQIGNMKAFIAQLNYTNANESVLKGISTRPFGSIDANLISPYELKDRFVKWLGI